MNTFDKYGDALRAFGARCEVLEGLDHMGELTSIDRALRLVLGFLGSHPRLHETRAVRGAWVASISRARHAVE